MQAMVLETARAPLRMRERPTPVPAAREILLEVDGGVKPDNIRTQQRHAILLAQQAGHLAEKTNSLFVVIGPPHLCFTPRYIVRIELAEIGGARPPEIDRSP